MKVIQSLGMTDVPLVLVETPDTEQALRLALEDNLHPSTLEAEDGPVVIERFHRVAGYDINRLATEVAPLLGLPKSRDVVRRHLACAALLPDLADEVAQGKLRVRDLLEIAQAPAPVREVMLKALVLLRPSLSTVRLMRDRVFDLVLGRGTSPSDLCRLLPDTPGPQGAKDYLYLLDGLRFPTLRACEIEYDRAKALAPLPDEVAVSRPPLFEGDRLDFSFSAADPKEYRAIVSHLAASADDEKIKRLFKAGIPHGGEVRREE
jgi:hypothetical protein